MPRPAIAESRCSIVATRTSPLTSVVDRRVSPTFSQQRADFHRSVEIGAAEHDAGIRRRGPQGHVHLVTGVQAHAGRPDDVLKRTLLIIVVGTRGAAANQERMLTQF